MIKQIPRQFTEKDSKLTIEDHAAVLELTDYTVVVRGKWKMIRGTNKSGRFTVVLVGPHPVTSNLVGIQILMAAGFSDVDAMLALGVTRGEHKTWLKQQRARIRESKSQPRMGSTTALDDLKGK
ncbi:hypothetical protein MPK71_gp287 [Erwinia phage pEa_SNUABM_1]|uniref:Uncharacterized protein n=1 Tax=Erwinia phage pEa_SNUABM_1 TaxID=2869543 RepID=A0AAE7XLN3_9CAUD|nr:hypothetical protein MPK71_gp287 [Erwinia phage pEa_SNUABM_1]QZE57496.1 hypothetical protein pEaSNUABM1_00287 [Erwinia phage pEa_SNUABM_1]